MEITLAGFVGKVFRKYPVKVTLSQEGLRVFRPRRWRNGTLVGIARDSRDTHPTIRVLIEGQKHPTNFWAGFWRVL